MTSRTYPGALERLSGGAAPDAARLALASCCSEGAAPRRKSCYEGTDAGIPVSLATVYNTLHQFTAVGLLREVVVDMGQSYFDTNTSHHHHFFDESTGALTDIPDDDIEIGRLPTPPLGSEIERVEVIVRLRPA
jgi:Fur family iron response transcriptional regulator